jgi:DivIVA domain-containing protein
MDWLKDGSSSAAEGPEQTPPEPALGPADITAARFTPVRFSEGYDMDEVDNLLDRVVTSWTADRARIAELEAQLADQATPGNEDPSLSPRW